MNSVKLKEERASLMENLSTMVTLAESETRELTKAETTEFDSVSAKIDSINTNIERAEKLESLNASMAATSGVKQEIKQPKEVSEYRFTDAVAAAYSGRLDGLVKEMDEEAKLESRGKLMQGVCIPSSVLHARAVTTASPGTDLGSYIDQLFNNSVLIEAGANYYSGLVADRAFPVISGMSSSFVAENNTTDVDGAGTLTPLTLSPTKLISVVDMSAELMAQNVGAEAAFRRNMAASQMATFEGALLTSGNNIGNAPQSIFSALFDAGNAITAAVAVAMEGAIIGGGVNPSLNKLSWILNGAALTSAKAAVLVTAVSALLDPRDKTLNGYNYYCSSNVGNTDGSAPATSVEAVFGDFSKVHIGQFGGLSLIYDPYTRAAQGLGRIVATNLMDGKVAQIPSTATVNDPLQAITS